MRIICVVVGAWLPAAALAQTAQGELESTTPPYMLPSCSGGVNAGQLCAEDADCPGSTCPDRIMFDLTVGVEFSPTPTQLQVVEDWLSDISAYLFDVTDGQAQIGSATIVENATSTLQGDMRVKPAVCYGGPTPGASCVAPADCAGGNCGTWFGGSTGQWQKGSLDLSINLIDGTFPYASIPNMPLNFDPALAGLHELLHLAFDTLDEYEQSNGGPFASCPDVDAHLTPSCVMDGREEHTGDPELCWGHGNPLDLADLSTGNHDPKNITEQSQGRSSRSCWDQVAWAYPSVIVPPAGAPDPGTGGGTVLPTVFTVVDADVRVVLVLDESGSMAQETPSRMERLKVAAADFVALSETGSELGIVSFSTDADPLNNHVGLSPSPLPPPPRTAWNSAIAGLSPGGQTDIADGLQRARTMLNAGGITNGSAIVLMTDGLHNQPPPQSAADAALHSVLVQLRAEHIPVYVTCLGASAIASQCTYIANQTGGIQQDAAFGGGLQEAFADVHEHIAGLAPVGTLRGALSRGALGWVDVDDARVVSFVALHDDPGAVIDLEVTAPDGVVHVGTAIPQGAVVRVAQPATGPWLIDVPATRSSGSVVVRSYVDDPAETLRGWTREPSVRLSAPIELHLQASAVGGHLTSGQTWRGQVRRPDGTTDVVTVDDLGRGADETAGDGLFSGEYAATDLVGAYTFTFEGSFGGWSLTGGEHAAPLATTSPPFTREVRLTAAVQDVVRTGLDLDGGAAFPIDAEGAGCAHGGPGLAGLAGLGLLLGLRRRRR